MRNGVYSCAQWHITLYEYNVRVSVPMRIGASSHNGEAMRNEANSITVRIGVTPSSTRKIPKLRVHFGKLCATHIKFQSLMRNSDTKFQHTTRNFSTNCHAPMRNMTHSEILQLRATRDNYANSSE